MLTTGEYVELTGLDTPESFPALLITADEILHARTLQQYRTHNLPEIPLTIFKRALALQIAYMDSRGGIDAWGDPAAMMNGFTIGRFSLHSASSSAAAYASINEQLLAPDVAVLLPTLMGYARAQMDGECI